MVSAEKKAELIHTKTITQVQNQLKIKHNTALIIQAVSKSVTYLETMKITKKQYQKALLIIKQYETQQKPKDIFELLKQGFDTEVKKYIIEKCDFEIDETFFHRDIAYGLEVVIERKKANEPIAIGAIEFLKAIKKQGRLTHQDYLDFC